MITISTRLLGLLLAGMLALPLLVVRADANGPGACSCGGCSCDCDDKTCVCICLKPIAIKAHNQPAGVVAAELARQCGVPAR